MEPPKVFPDFSTPPLKLSKLSAGKSEGTRESSATVTLVDNALGGG